MDEKTSTSSSNNKKTPKWMKWIVFYAVGILAFVVGQALIDFNLIGSKWWFVTTVCIVFYWLLFLRKTTIEVDQTIKYDWDKKK